MTSRPMWAVAALGAFAALFTLTVSTAGASSGEQTKQTKSYVFALSVGKSEEMWTPAQVRAKHPTSGEVMLGGTMGGAMSMGGSSRHLEVKIAKRPNGKVVTGAHPTIGLLDLSTGGAMAVKVPVAVMRGVDEGVADIHYGNNVDLIGGHKYRVTVGLAGEQAVFQVTAPKG
jgi:hypothetical protein